VPNPFPTRLPLLGLGMASLVLGTIGMMLFFMPVLGIPICASALLLGLIALIISMFQARGISLRWSLVGIGTSALALSINIAIAYAPVAEPGRRIVPRLWRMAPGIRYAPPPAPAR
jgi:hypothetical protein